MNVPATRITELLHLIRKRSVLSLIVLLAGALAFAATGQVRPVPTPTAASGVKSSPPAASTPEPGSDADRASDHLLGLSRKDRMVVFEEVWKRISERYYDPSFN